MPIVSNVAVAVARGLCCHHKPGRLYAPVEYFEQVLNIEIKRAVDGASASILYISRAPAIFTLLDKNLVK